MNKLLVAVGVALGLAAVAQSQTASPTAMYRQEHLVHNLMRSKLDTMVILVYMSDGTVRWEPTPAK